MISYNDFLANVTAEHLQLLAEFVLGRRVKLLTEQEAAPYRQRAVELFESELVWRVVEGRERDNGQVWITFDAYVAPQAQAYVTQAARERVQLSRLPLPVDP